MSSVITVSFLLLVGIAPALTAPNSSLRGETPRVSGDAGVESTTVRSGVDHAGPVCGTRPCFYDTGFEPEEGFLSGGIVDQPAGAAAYDRWDTGCGGTTASVVDADNPATGAQHLRLGHDPMKAADPFSCVVAARVPSNANAAAYPVNYNAVTISVDVAMTPFAGTYNVQPASSQWFLPTRMAFTYYGIMLLQQDNTFPEELGPWDTSGAYQNFTIHYDPCGPQVDYYYGGRLIYQGAFGGMNFEDPVERLLFFHDNVSGSRMDVDNVRIERAPGDCENAPGSCCDTLEGLCQRDVILSACPPPNVWTARGTCSTCFPAPGACCDQLTGECADDVTRSQCNDLVNIWTAHASCDTPEAGECDQIYGTCCHTLYGGCTGIDLADQCFGPDRQFKLGIPCEPDSCPPATGACCVHDDTNISGKNCTDGATRIACEGSGGEWHRDQTCEQVSCQNAIPTVSEWGLLIVALLLLSGAKVFFGRREALA